MDLNTVWFLLVGVLIVGYAVLDGFDLGVGSLYFILAKSDQEKRMLLNSIGPVWDANEVWLLTGGGALFAAFPVVYASVFSGFYLAMMLVVFGLIFRAVAMEYRGKDQALTWQRTWDWLFVIGSFLPALLFGVAVGNVVEGLPLDSAQNYTGGFFHLLNPYALLIGLVGLSAFLLQGTVFILLKLEGPVFKRAKALVNKIWIVFMALYGIATLWSLKAATHLFINYRQHSVLWIIPVITWLAMFAVPLLVKGGKLFSTFLASSTSIAGLVLILAVGLFPNLVPAQVQSLSLTIYNSSSSLLTLKVMLIIAMTGVPIVLFYTTYVYKVFKGKVKLDNSHY